MPKHNIEPPEAPHARVRATVRAITSTVGTRAFHVSEVTAAGISADRVERACMAGLLTRVGRGWYVVTASDPCAVRSSRSSGTRAGPGIGARDFARLQARPGGFDAVLCGVSAATAWGLPVPPGVSPAAGLHVLSSRDDRSWGGRRIYETIHRWDVAEQFITTGPQGVRMTDPLQTALDLSRGIPMPFALAPLDAAVRLSVDLGLPLDVVRELLAARVEAMAGRPGTRSLAVAADLADHRSESPLESIVRGRIVEGGLPRPVLQVDVMGASGRGYRCDLALQRPCDPPGVHGLLIEADGLGKYAVPEDLAAEKRRQHDLELRGYEVLRVLYAEAVRRPGDLLARIHWCLARAG